MRPRRQRPGRVRATLVPLALYATTTLATVQTSGTSAAAATPCLTLMAAGDILLDRGVRKQAYIESDPAYALRGLPKLFRPADLVLANLECPLTRRDQPASKRYVFRCDPRAAPLLRRAGFDLLTLANNHSYDQGREGILDTITHLEAAGIASVGAGPDLASAHAPRLLTRRGVRLAVLGIVTIPLEGIIFRQDRPTPAIATEQLVLRSLRRARASADVVVVTVHWGCEFKHTPSADQRRWASLLRQNGADIIIGHHPHVLQTIEETNGKWTFYSLGNFVFDQIRQPSRLTAAARLTVCKDAAAPVRRVEVLPMELRKTRPVLASRSTRAAVAKLLRGVSPEIRFDPIGDQRVLTVRSTSSPR